MKRQPEAKSPPVRIFHPTMPSWRDLREALVFAVLSLLALIGWVREGNVAVLAASLAMTSAALWLAYRGRVFGDPTLIAEPTHVRFRKRGREVSAPWSDIESVSFGPYLRRELWLVRRSGDPIRFSDSMTTAQGERFDMLIEDYLPPPKARR